MLNRQVAIRGGAIAPIIVACTLFWACRCPAEETASTFHLSTAQFISIPLVKSGTFTAEGAIEDSGWVVTQYPFETLDMEVMVMTGEFGALEVLLYNREAYPSWYGDLILADFEITDGAGAYAGLSGGGTVSGFLNYEGSSGWYETLEFFGELDSAPIPPPPPPPLPEMGIDDVSIVEGRRGTGYAHFTVALSAASEETVSVEYTTADGTAHVADGDYEEAFGVLRFEPGDTAATITVKIFGDRRREPDETFFVYLGNPAGATLADDEGIGTILTDDGPKSRR